MHKQWLGTGKRVSGKFSFQGMADNGDFEGYVVFIPTPEGHVGYITESEFSMTGKWKP